MECVELHLLMMSLAFNQLFACNIHYYNIGDRLQEYVFPAIIRYYDYLLEQAYLQTL
jgi:hypothetical protein